MPLSDGGALGIGGIDQDDVETEQCVGIRKTERISRTPVFGSTPKCALPIRTEPARPAFSMRGSD
jgi:hypothetical protein